MKIYLASKSPRRKDLLQLIGCEFTVLDTDIPEYCKEGESPQHYSQRITEEKLRAAWQKLEQDKLAIHPILCADTEVVLDNTILGKPQSYEDAFSMLKRYSGGEHLVITSVGIKYGEFQKILCNETKVFFDVLSDEDIHAYLATGNYKDKAGAYGIQSYCAQFITKIEGCFYSVMGLPLNSVRQLINDLKCTLTEDAQSEIHAMLPEINNASNAPDKDKPSQAIQRKKVALLAIGDEFLRGDLLESNAHHSAKKISELGGEVCEICIVSDNQQAISKQMERLLATHDALVTIGGLGPTSDDNTRFALGDALHTPLTFDLSSWQHVQDRLSRFNLTITEANKRQAYFPQGAQVLNNPLGTANACFIAQEGRDVFMLPGPPKEYFPLFDTYVIPHLETSHYFKKQLVFKFLTLGLSEGEISEQVDAIALPHKLQTAYRWDYPYLTIKIIAEEEQHSEKPIEAIKQLLHKNTVSTNDLHASELLKETLQGKQYRILVELPAELESAMQKNHPQLTFTHNDDPVDLSLYNGFLEYKVQWPDPKNQTLQVIYTEVIGRKMDGSEIYHHQFKVPKREQDVEKALQSYLSWQLVLFINVLEASN